MKTTLTTVLLLLLFQIGISQQEPIYVNFYNNHNNYGLTPNDHTSDECVRWKSNTSKEFPSRFVYQLVDTNGVFATTLDEINALGFTVMDSDSNCGSPSGVRAEAALEWNNLPESTSNISYYKIKFHIPEAAINMNGYSNEHNIFQITSDEVATGSLWSSLPQFLLQIRHQDSNPSRPILELNYGLEFSLNGCDRAPLNENTGKIDTLNVTNRCGDLTSRQRIPVTANYGWNEMLIEIRWSSGSNGWMNVYLNDTLIQNPGSTSYTFEGNNVYNNTMFPDGNNSEVNDDFVNYMKLGQYRFGTLEETTIYYEYFYADNNLNNIGDDFKTYVINDNNGVMDMTEDLLFKNIEGADEYVLLLAKDENIQYKGNPDNSLTYDDLLASELDLEFYTNYTSNVRAKYNEKGFDGEYLGSKTIRFEPDTKLSSTFCGRDNIRLTETLTIDKIQGADGYVLYIRNTNNTSVEYYQGVPATGQIDVSQLFQNLNLSFNTEYNINVRAKFDQYNMQGQYSDPCQIRFTSPFGIGRESVSKTIVYPNPTSDRLNIKSEQQIQSIQVIDVFGNLKKVGVLNDFSGINTQELPKGLYFMQINYGNYIEHLTFVKD